MDFAFELHLCRPNRTTRHIAELRGVDPAGRIDYLELAYHSAKGIRWKLINRWAGVATRAQRATAELHRSGGIVTVVEVDGERYEADMHESLSAWAHELYG